MRRRPGNCSNSIKNLLAERSSINYEVPAFFGIFRPKKRKLGEAINLLGIFSICLQSIFMTQHFPDIFSGLLIYFFSQQNFKKIEILPTKYFNEKIKKCNQNIFKRSSTLVVLLFCRHKIEISLILRISNKECSFRIQ